MLRVSQCRQRFDNYSYIIKDAELSERVEKMIAVLQSPPPADDHSEAIGLAKTFFCKVCNQMTCILQDQDSTPIYQHIAASISLKMAINRPKLMKKLIFEPVLSHLLQYYNQSCLNYEEADLSGNMILSNESQISRSISIIQTFLMISDTSDGVTKLLSNLAFVPLYQLYIKSKLFKTARTKEIFDVLQVMLHFLDLKLQAEMLILLCEESYRRFACEIKPHGGGLCFVRSPENRNIIDPELLCQFLKDINNPELAGEFFLSLVEAQLINQDNEELSAFYSTCILVIMESFGEMLLKNTLQVLKFVKTQLIENDESRLFMGLTLLNQLFSSEFDENSSTSKESFQSTLKDIKIILQTLSGHQSAQIQALVSSVKLNVEFTHKISDERKISEKRFRDALKELGDELLPIRAHGMSQLKSLVLEKDPIAAENINSILIIFLDFVNDEDRYGHYF